MVVSSNHNIDCQYLGRASIQHVGLQDFNWHAIKGGLSPQTYTDYCVLGSLSLDILYSCSMHQSKLSLAHKASLILQADITCTNIDQTSLSLTHFSETIYKMKLL